MSDRVRPEYAALAGEFSALAAQFGHHIDARLERDIGRLAAAMECIDRHADEIADDDARACLWDSVVAILEHGEVPDGLHDRRELARATLDIREVAVQRGVLARMLRIVRKEVATSETMRLTEGSQIYVDAVLREGHLTAALALLIADSACGREFRRFFFRLGGPANVVDKLLDARGDRARGEIRVEPGVRLHARLALAILVRLPAILASHPRWWSVLGLGVRYLVVPQVGLRPLVRSAHEPPPL